MSASGRGAKGVRAMGLDRGDKVVCAFSIPRLPEGETDKRTLLAVTTDGKFKRTLVSELPTQLRAGKGGRIIVKKKSRPHQLWGGLLLNNERDSILVVQEDGEKIQVEVRSIPTGAANGSGYAISGVSGNILHVIAEVSSEPEEDEELSDDPTEPGIEPIEFDSVAQDVDQLVLVDVDKED